MSKLISPVYRAPIRARWSESLSNRSYARRDDSGATYLICQRLNCQRAPEPASRYCAECTTVTIGESWEWVKHSFTLDYPPSPKPPKTERLRDAGIAAEKAFAAQGFRLTRKDIRISLLGAALVGPGRRIYRVRIEAWVDSRKLA